MDAYYLQTKGDFIDVNVFSATSAFQTWLGDFGSASCPTQPSRTKNLLEL